MDSRQFTSPVYDRRDVVDFVKEIEQYPCLYDTSITDYRNPALKGKAWSLIAKKRKLTVPECKIKWNTIRISYARSLKEQHEKADRRPYHLADELEFLRPFMNVKVRLSNYRQEQMDCEVPIAKEELCDDTDPFEIEYLEDNNTSNNSYQTNDTAQEPNEVVYIQKSRSTINILDENPRKLFLLSLIPDILSFTDAEMRTFRREIIRICDDIMNKDENNH